MKQYQCLFSNELRVQAAVVKSGQRHGRVSSESCLFRHDSLFNHDFENMAHNNIQRPFSTFASHILPVENFKINQVFQWGKFLYLDIPAFFTFFKRFDFFIDFQDKNHLKIALMFKYCFISLIMLSKVIKTL